MRAAVRVVDVVAVAIALAVIACGGGSRASAPGVSNRPAVESGSGSGSGSGSDAELAMAQRFADRMCACTSAACVNAVTEEQQAWERDESQHTTAMTDDRVQALGPIHTRADRCALRYVPADDRP